MIILPWLNTQGRLISHKCATSSLSPKKPHDSASHFSSQSHDFINHWIIIKDIFLHLSMHILNMLFSNYYHGESWVNKLMKRTTYVNLSSCFSHLLIKSYFVVSMNLYVYLIAAFLENSVTYEKKLTTALGKIPLKAQLAWDKALWQIRYVKTVSICTYFLVLYLLTFLLCINFVTPLPASCATKPLNIYPSFIPTKHTNTYSPAPQWLQHWTCTAWLGCHAGGANLYLPVNMTPKPYTFSLCPMPVLHSNTYFPAPPWLQHYPCPP